MTPPPFVTVVLPCYNEREHVLLEIQRICAALDNSRYAGRYELMVIDDGSTDGTSQVIEASLQDYPAVRFVAFRRNGGSGTARKIGTADARGSIVVWTDADLTYPNERIP